MKFTALILIATLPVFAEETKKTDLLADGLASWTFVTKDGETPVETAWKVKDGVLSTDGEPIGYLRTKETFETYTLTFEWRWMPDTEDNNSGLLLHISKPGVAGPWPECIEAQLMQDNAGDFWSIGSTMEATGENKGKRWIRTADPIEKNLGEWNSMTVKCAGGEIVVHVNGVLVNKGKNASVLKGAIGFQAEGKTIEFRKITLER